MKINNILKVCSRGGSLRGLFFLLSLPKNKKNTTQEDPSLVEEARALQFEQTNIITDVLEGAIRPFQDAIQNARDMMDAPETFAQIKEKLNGLLDGSEQQEKFWRRAQTNMGPIMKRLDNDPVLFKDIEGMVRDKTFRKNLENMFENERFKNFIESVSVLYDVYFLCCVYFYHISFFLKHYSFTFCVIYLFISDYWNCNGRSYICQKYQQDCKNVPKSGRGRLKQTDFALKFSLAWIAQLSLTVHRLGFHLIA